MFKVATDPTFTHDVTVFVPVDNGHEEAKLRTTFRVLDGDETDAMDPTSKDGILSFLERAVVTFSDLTDDDDQPMDCTSVVRSKILSRPFVRVALFCAYTAAVTKARLGN